MTSRTASRRAAAARPAPTARRLPVGWIALGALVVVVAIGIAVAVVRGGGDGDDTGLAPYGPVRVDGAALPPYAAGGADPAVGRAAPALSGRTPEGDRVELGAGEPTLVAFVAHWCPHCQAEVPRIVAAARDGKLDGVRLVAVLTGTNADAPNYPPAPWLQRERWPGEVLLDDRSYDAAAAYGLAGYPFLVALDAEGNVAARTSGELPAGGIEALVAAAKG